MVKKASIPTQGIRLVTTFLRRIIPWRANESAPATDQQSTRPARIGLALSCGGAKSLAHIGVLEVLEQHNIPIHAISGSSFGAYIGALWATGHSVEQMKVLAEQMQDPKTLRSLADPVIPPIKGLFYGNKVKEHLGKSIGNTSFEELDRKLLVISANLDTYERIVFRKGCILDAVHASCAMPGFVVPVEINGMRCTDGGVVDPVPVGALHKFTDIDYVIAVSTLPSLQEIDTHAEAEMTAKEDAGEVQPWWKNPLSSIGTKFNPSAKGNVIDNLRRALRASQIRMAHDSCLRANIAIHPVSMGASWHEYDRFEHFIELGRQHATAVLPDIQKFLEPIPINQNDQATK